MWRGGGGVDESEILTKKLLFYGARLPKKLVSTKGGYVRDITVQDIRKTMFTIINLFNMQNFITF